MKSLLLSLVLLDIASIALGGVVESQAGDPLTVYDAYGNAVIVSNRFDGTAHYVQVTSYNRNRWVNWEQIHKDGLNERAHSVALDGGGNILVAGTRGTAADKVIWTIKFAPNGNFLWERWDSFQGCHGLYAASNAAGDAWVAGSCASGGGYPTRLIRYDPYGNYLWAQSYEENGRGYIRGLSVDFTGRASLTVEIVSGYYGGSSSVSRTVVFDGRGNRLVLY